MRSQIIKVLVLFSILSGVFVLHSCQEVKKEENKKPNILILFADDQRAGTINALGNQEIITPHIDKLVNEGVSFTNTYIMGGSSAAVCAPSRAMLMTGRHLYGIEKQNWAANISEKNITIPEVFKNAGYVTFGTGKQHNGKEVFARGFSDGGEIFFGGMSDHWNVPVYHFDSTGKYDKKVPFIRKPGKNKHVEYLNNCDHIIQGKHSSELFADAAIDFLNKHDKTKPFLAYVSFTAPHDPRSMPEESLHMYDTAAIPIPSNFLPEHPWDFGEFKIRDEKLAEFPRTTTEVKTHLRDYYAMITHMDDQIGRIIKALKKSSEYENTIIVFTADNGLAVGQHGMFGKQNLYEHSIHIPFVISGKGIPENVKNESLCYLYDLFPTLCEIVEIDAPETIQGESFYTALKDGNQSHRESMCYGYKEFMRAYRKDDFKLIEYFVKGERNSQLFNLKVDPFEENNLLEVEGHFDKYHKMKSEMIQEMKMLGDTNKIYKEFLSE